MDQPSRNLLSSLVRGSRVASLGTLHDGGPFVSLVLTAPDQSFSVWFIHISRLSQLARLTLVGRAAELESGSSEEDSASEIYLAKFPHMAEIIGSLGDFSFWVIRPEAARFVGGLARAFTLTPEALRKEIAEGGA